MPTWAGKSEFECDGFVGRDITIHYGNGFKSSIELADSELKKLLAVFRGKEVPLGTSRTTAPRGSVGAWLQANVTRTAIASYVGPSLIADGYAGRGSRRDLIKFL